jgi:hypothetical protein
MPELMPFAPCPHCARRAWLLDPDVTDEPQWICRACYVQRYPESMRGTVSLEADSVLTVPERPRRSC